MMLPPGLEPRGSPSVYCFSVEDTRISPRAARAAIRAARTTLRPRSSSELLITKPECRPTRNARTWGAPSSSVLLKVRCNSTAACRPPWALLKEARNPSRSNLTIRPSW